MKWLVQEFLNFNSNIVRMLNALDKSNTDYLLVRINNNNTLTVIDKENKLPIDDSAQLLQWFNSSDDVFVYGSKKFAQIAKELNIKPGSLWNENFEFEVFRDFLGEELLNHEFISGELFELNPPYETFFIRPTGNTKLFTGMTVTKDEFLTWKEREKELGKNSFYLGQKLMVSPVKEIIAEYRFFIVKQEIVTGSSYPDISGELSDELITYTKRMIEKFLVAKAFVIDIAKTNQGYKVVEYNNINTSGLYACDEISLVEAINKIK